MKPTQGADPALASDLLLLVLNEQTGRFPRMSSMDAIVSVALFVDLAARGRLEFFGDDHRVFVTDASPTGSPVLDDVLTMLQQAEGDRPTAAIRLIAKGRFDQVVQGLVDSGALVEHETRALGAFRRRTWRHSGRGPISSLRKNLDDVLVQGAKPTVRTALLISVMVQLKLLTEAMPGHGGKRVAARAEEIMQEASGTNFPPGALGESDETWIFPTSDTERAFYLGNLF